jgi:hypothetical protein
MTVFNGRTSPDPTSGSVQLWSMERMKSQTERSACQAIEAFSDNIIRKVRTPPPAPTHANYLYSVLFLERLGLVSAQRDRWIQDRWLSGGSTARLLNMPPVQAACTDQ